MAMDGMHKDFSTIGREVLYTARNRLYMALPYMDVVLCALAFQPGNEVTATLATDGETLHYDGAYVSECFMRGDTIVNRAYFHTILHCLLRHLVKKRSRMPELWDLACDVAVESVLDELDIPCLHGGYVPAKQTFYGECRGDMPVLTAEGIYHRLLRLSLPEHELARLQKVFLVDDHSLWAPSEQDNQEQSQHQDQDWATRSEQTQTGLETILTDQGNSGETVLEQLQVANRDSVDYRTFLRRFALPREVVEVDSDAFDYGFYSYGLRLYGNLPLIEPPETREERRIEDFVIVVDTSMSTSGALVREFLTCTYAILRSTQTYTRKVNIHILQCDDQIRSDTVIHDLADLQAYMDYFELSGGSATDFRPVFEHVEKLQAQGVFRSLRGLIYFTDGMGVYPKKRPSYETAFILLEEPPLPVAFPSWAIRLVLDVPELENALRQAAEEAPELIDLSELPQL